MAARSSIPLHFLDDETKFGMYVHRLDEIDADEVKLMQAHRDNHCNFFFQESGTSHMMVDFREVSANGCAIFCILPGQVHMPLSLFNARGWFIAADLMSLGDQYRSVFEEFSINGEPISLNSEQAKKLSNCFDMLSDLSKQPDDTFFHQATLNAMLQVFLGMFAAIVLNYEQQFSASNSRTATITRQFKSLLVKNFKTMKSPSEYARVLNISPSYLNEVVKQHTGLAVSILIHQEIMMEARRLLYFTDLSVKQIAFSLGYDDHTYFSRLFRKVIQVSPGQFRSVYRK
ncbi:helix-turn-helix domain-containing protein [Dyadobacter psychrotolerans]|uniref:AraC family transcriptional regulator n=1 Tax=Dyadobacter psychrotolerans TaxID=2541721 RepID=A0A4R5DKD1_9BACT|nr:helix-turn-helix domain-containing protein [Dyadobacter psychrotolerans]TDE14622.1 AraC family transcriptional regulator [Dyadobacter psychrotolerans]